MSTLIFELTFNFSIGFSNSVQLLHHDDFTYEQSIKCLCTKFYRFLSPRAIRLNCGIVKTKYSRTQKL